MNVPSQPVHQAMRTEHNGRESLFECLMAGCRFRARLDHVDGSYTLLDRGDPAFRHHGSTGPIVMSVDDRTEPPRAA